ncbi:MAG: haloacid dehalogenase [Acidiferrobacteraceae bacterium]|jgi:putative hydrolase of the HAD superfamily|nr:haloacid dehalogenase [Acidiferrobacteraceae bacterium]MCP4829562.1 GMP/IMP nucleotidase [Pseudomonadota bacterium]MDP6950191.1 GMP/IMP nucleotidase [Arenicellales bacterium]
MIDWTQIDSVFLDLDGTLLDLHFDNHFWTEFIPQRYASERQIGLEEARDTLFSRMRSLRGKLDWYCVDFWTRETGLDIVSLKVELRHLIRTRPGARDFLAALQTDHRRVVLVTNASPATIDLKMDQTGIRPMFDRIVSSHTLGYPKEHPMFWTDLQEIESFLPSRTLLIDDNLTVLRAAGKYGIAHLLAVVAPDSTRPTADPEEFTGLHAFEDISSFFHSNPLARSA